MDSQSEKAEREESRLQFNKQLFKTYLALDHWHRFRLRLFLEGILVGIAGGLLIALFRFLLGLFRELTPCDLGATGCCHGGYFQDSSKFFLLLLFPPFTDYIILNWLVYLLPTPPRNFLLRFIILR